MPALTLSVLSTAKDGKSITLKLTSDGAAPTAVTLKWRYWTTTAATSKVLSGAEVTAILSSAGLLVTPDFIGLTTTAGLAFADGVHHVIAESTNYTSADLKAFVNKAAEKHITQAIGKLAEKDDECRGCERKLNKLLRFHFAADVQYDSKDYDGAHNLVVAISKYCCDCDCKS